MNSLEVSKYIFATSLILAGILHFMKPRFFVKIMPAYLSAHKMLVLLSGVAEVTCGILLLFPSTQRVGAYLTVGLLLAVFPANIEMTYQYYQLKKKGFWLTVLRLPLQFVLIWWVIKFLN